jgi:hypothetical protein
MWGKCQATQKNGKKCPNTSVIMTAEGSFCRVHKPKNWSPPKTVNIRDYSSGYEMMEVLRS